jgi:hypothetical protein
LIVEEETMVFGTKQVGVSTLQEKLDAEKPPCGEQPLWAELNDGCGDVPNKPSTLRLFDGCETAEATTGGCYWNQTTFHGFSVP